MADYVQVYTANGHLDAEMIRLFLESQGIQAMTSGESLGSVYGLTVGPLGEVKVYVPEEQAAEAQQLLEDMENGKYDLSSLQAAPPEEPAEGDDEPISED